MRGLGVDIGGSGIKAAVVDLDAGDFAGERERIPTPQPATPVAVAATVARLVRHFGLEGPVGIGFPAVVRDGVVHTASNIDDAWIGAPAQEILTEATGRPCFLVNDADAAGLAEMRFGAGRGHLGTVLMVTLGTGIGTALFREGVLVPNTELGHLEVDGNVAEKWASDAVRDRKDLSWEQWGRRLDAVLRTYDRLLWPDRIILGGGVSKKATKYMRHLDTRAEIVVAELRNRAGIVGAAAYAQEHAR